MAERSGLRGRGIGESLSRDTGPVREIVKRIDEKGRITFAEFMEVALYWHDGGYYTSSRDRWGRGGDYVTSIDISPAFSKALAREIHEMWLILGSPDAFELIEPGAGRGWLSKGILSTIKDLYPDLYMALKLRLVEKNPFLREAPTEHVTWHGDLKEIGRRVTGCVISNELIDSFPVHRVEQREGLLKEVYVGFDGQSFKDVYGPLSTSEIGDYFKKAGITLAEGQKAEVNLDALRWVQTVSSMLERGFVITIDYGLPARELYAPERRDGTLLCHFRHTVNDDPFENIGQQDITTHVDFTALAAEGRAVGLELTGFTTQKNFLLGLGILEELSAHGAQVRDFDKIRWNQAVKELIMPGGMGDTFKVLVQHKGVDKRDIMGFSFKDMSGYLF
jgi:SAM-dependent MidA family methyltransferase